ncbi:EEP domain-containing protein, partial [Pseudomonas aeruginosa]|nr:EEP domain-containing protein [Pseudomonas aeruginosa]MBF3023464.1 EEP domain-containing protein [Pseudomonas aeruginosa]MBF3045780.1 EEP domain-containing protein [Pseudomonas aeruginosa]MBW6071590.1 EEP domain-containing protein [Pseudomonas aeruginosa]MBW6287201.1 EEP domain-containing protein [Pseudomonas aeruginosa]
ARSFPARWPVLPLDRIYLRNARGRQPRILSRRPWSHLSDHLPLAVEVEP